MLVPKLVTTLKTYDRAQFARDAVAGVIVGVVALPLAIAFAIASGVTPDRGLYTAAIGALIAIQQLRDALGLQMPDPPAELVERVGAYVKHAGTLNPYAVGIT